MAKYTRIGALYQVLGAISKAEEEGLTGPQLKLKFPLKNISEATSRLAALGYITNKISGYRVRARGDSSRIKHNYDKTWYITELGEAALQQYLEKRGGLTRATIIVIAVAVGLFVYFIFIWNP